MDDNRQQQLKEKIKHCQTTVSSLLDDYGSLLSQKPTETTDDSDHSGEQAPIVDDVNTQLMDFDLALESIQQQIKIAREKYLHDQPALHTSDECSTIQSDDNQKEVNNELVNIKVKLSNYYPNNCEDNNNINNGQKKAKLNPTAPEPQALFTGTLPDDFYLLLMSVMGIQECLISNRRVCSFWNELVLERCHNQKSLKLFENFANLMEYSELLLKFEKLDDTSLILQLIGDDLIFEVLETDHEQLADSLEDGYEEEDGEEDDKGVIQKKVLTRAKRLEASKVMTIFFPNLEQLVLCPGWDTFINIEHILQFYAKQLTSLTMTNIFDGNGFISKLSFPLLKSLNIFNFTLKEDQLLSLLPQLESLSLKIARTSEISLETLLRTGTQLQELNMAEINSVYSSPVDQFSKRPKINTNLKKFSFYVRENESQVLEFISRNLTSIESLKLNLRRRNFQLNLLISYLVPLHQLHSLTLQTSISFFLLNDIQLAEIQPLSSVRHLKLQLFGYSSLSMDLFSNSLFAAFPKVEKVLIAFVGHNGNVDCATFAKFEAFAGKYPDVVQLFRSKDMSKFTNLPNAVAPLLGHRRQMYEEYIKFEELFGVPLCKLVASPDNQEVENRSNLKIALRPEDRLTAMSNLFELLKSDAFTFTFEIANLMIEHMVKCALKYGPSEGELFLVTCNCVLNLLLDCNIVDVDAGDYNEPTFLYSENLNVYYFFKLILKLVKHYETQKFNDKNLLFQLYDCIVRILREEFKCFRHCEEFNTYKLLEILLKLADNYKAQKLNVCDDYDEYLLLGIRELIADLLIMFENDRLDKVISKFIRSDNRVYRVEMALALLQCCKSTDNCFK